MSGMPENGSGPALVRRTRSGNQSMSTQDSAAHESAATTRSIDHDRFVRACTEGMDAVPVAPLQYDVTHDGEVYTVDLSVGHCGCDDHRYRGDRVVCKHQIVAAIAHCYRDGRNTELVAQVLAHARSADCPHGYDGCPGPTGPSLPCQDCISVSGGDEWLVWCRVTNHDEWLDVDAEATTDHAVATDGGSPATNDEELDEACPDCGSRLLRTPADDPDNPHDGAAVMCPSCLRLVRVETPDGGHEDETCAQCGREGVEGYVCEECADANDERREDDVSGSERADFGGGEGGVDKL